MEKLLVVGAFLIGSLIGLSQSSSEMSFSQRLNKVNFSGTSDGFKQLALDAGLSWECCIEEKCPCTDLKDPWEVKKSATFKEQIATILKDKSAKEVQKDFALFEQAILEGKGKKMILQSMVQKAFDKHPGYSKKAIKKRFEIYILSMESETEDE